MTRTRWIAAIAAVGVIAVAAFGVWYLVFRDDAPPPVSLDRLDTEERPRTTTAAAADLDGTWVVDHTIGSFEDFSGSFAGFRVREELVSIGAKTAVGRTPDVTGSIEIDGATIPRAEFEVDMTTLTTDDARRDNSLRDQAIETSRFPTAAFTLTRPTELGSIPADGERIMIDATGDLTVHGVTREVTVPLEAQRSGDQIDVIGSLEIAFADFAIDRPRAAAVLSVEDRGVIEVQLRLTKEP